MNGIYVGTKRVKANPMTRGEYNQYRGWEIPADEIPQDEGYLVEYLDGGKANHPDHEGYISWSPKDVFDQAYRLEADEGDHPPVAIGGFEEALKVLKNGGAVTRKGWNGAGQFVYGVPANAYQAQTGVAKAHFGEGSLVPYAGYFALKNAQDVVSVWVPSIGDLLAEDWHVVLP